VPILDTLKRGVLGVIAWLFALLLFFPIFWMTSTAFKTEQQAYSSSLIFTPTLDKFSVRCSRAVTTSRSRGTLS